MWNEVTVSTCITVLLCYYERYCCTCLEDTAVDTDSQSKEPVPGISIKSRPQAQGCDDDLRKTTLGAFCSKIIVIYT